MTMRMPVSVIITDLDNTLYDWVDIWFNSFRPMLDEIVRISNIPEVRLIEEIKVIHQRHGTSEYSLLIEEIPSLQALHPGENLSVLYDDAIHAFRKGRKAALRLYPSVEETLREIKSSGGYIVAYTESREFHSQQRLIRTGLDELIDVLYSPKDHALPDGISPTDLRTQSASSYVLRHSTQKYTPKGHIKPDSNVLRDIISDVGATVNECVYIGDDLVKDVSMAQGAGVLDAWAKYGKAHHREEYDLLRAVTHWKPESVEKQKSVTEHEVRPSIILDSQFGQILEHIRPVEFRMREIQHERRK